VTSAGGTIASLWRYPVKSMLGEKLNNALVTERGLAGDRVFALVDRETGKVVSAKEPRKWAKMFEFRATYLDRPGGNGLARVRITLLDGASVTSDLPTLNEILSRELGREVALAASAPEAPSLEEYWPDIEGLAYREVVTDVAMPPGTFFDLGVVHLLTTATIDRLGELYPGGRFEVRRFRPNVVVATEERGFVENGWIGRALALGDEVRLEITRPCPRCVMTTLPQDDLPKDPGILRAAARHNDANVGVYASVVRDGTLALGDAVRLE
jgi:uncharacterized protein YcbX